MESGLSDHMIVLMMMPFVFMAALYVHELGHYCAARMAGMSVERVSIGFGKVLWQRQSKGGTLWRVHLWPFRAYVGIGDFHPQAETIWRRLFVVLAGPLSNLILPFFIMFLFLATFGKPSVLPIVTGVEAGLPAEKAGVEPGDLIFKINGEPIEDAAQIRRYTWGKPVDPLRVEIKRGNEIFTRDILPRWTEYRDRRGLMHAHGQIGASLAHEPYEYKALKSVNGFVVEGAQDGRKALASVLGQRALIGLKATDGKIHYYIMKLSPELNSAMLDKGGKDYEHFYPGTKRGNFYMKLSVTKAAKLSFARSLELIRNVAKVPLQLFPIDRQWLWDDAVVSADIAPVRFYLYKFTMMLGLFSVALGLINLLPLPGLDGSVVMIDVLEAVKKRELTRAEKARWLVAAFVLFYAMVIAANAPDMEAYYSALFDRLRGQ